MVRFLWMLFLQSSSNSWSACSFSLKEPELKAAIRLLYSSLLNCSFLKQYCLLRRLVHIKQSRQFLQFKSILELEQFSENMRKLDLLQLMHSIHSYRNSEASNTCI